MQGKEGLRTYTERQGTLLQDFIFVMRDKRKTLSESGIIELEQRHMQVVNDCLDEGLVTEICNIREKWKKNRI